jgi:hypothetical protein
MQTANVSCALSDANSRTYARSMGNRPETQTRVQRATAPAARPRRDLRTLRRATSGHSEPVAGDLRLGQRTKGVSWVDELGRTTAPMILNSSALRRAALSHSEKMNVRSVICWTGIVP